MVNRIKPMTGQESVWDYPRPPRLEAVSETLKIVFNGEIIAATNQAYRVLETSHPPVYYIPPADIQMNYLVSETRKTICEFKGMAHYWTLHVGDHKSAFAAWSYPQPAADFASMGGYLAFYASRVDECYVGEEKVIAQEGDFYSGWITSKIVGPFKGGAGTMGW